MALSRVGNHSTPTGKLQKAQRPYGWFKKLGGLLIENRWEGSRISSSIIGLGLNVKKSRQQLARAISLEEVGADLSAEECVESILKAISVSLDSILNPSSLHSDTANFCGVKKPIARIPCLQEMLSRRRLLVWISREDLF